MITNPIYSDYLLFEKESIKPQDIGAKLAGYDRFISAYNSSERVCEVFKQVVAINTHWLIFPEYQIDHSDLPTFGTCHIVNAVEENDAILDYLASFPLNAGERICIDSTGFIRPHLMFLLRYLHLIKWPSVDVIYSEPERYKSGSRTQFSDHISEVRPVRGFEGSHSRPLDSDGDYLIVGCGYDTDLMHAISNTHKQAIKIQVFPFPPLRPHMYQENRLKTEQCQGAFGRVMEQCFAPGYDPFVTAHTLDRVVTANAGSIDNLYLTPLATKPQVLGFVWYYLAKCINKPVSIVFPFSKGYNRETSTGLSEVWRYQMDFNLLASITTP